jgi:hypothetical protein
MPYGDDHGDLNRLEIKAVVPHDRSQATNHVAVATTQTDPPAGHAVALAHRRELDANILRTRRRQETRCLVAVVKDVGAVAEDEGFSLRGVRAPRKKPAPSLFPKDSEGWARLGKPVASPRLAKTNGGLGRTGGWVRCLLDEMTIRSGVGAPVPGGIPGIAVRASSGTLRR